MKRVIVTGASRGIGRAIAERFAKDGHRVALLGRSMEFGDSPLSGTLKETAARVEALGGKAHAVAADFRCGEEVEAAMHRAMEEMGGDVDVLVNNASALSLDSHSSVKNMDLLYRVNTRGCLLGIQTCLDSLSRSRGSVVTLSPPIRMGRLEWISDHPAYTISKYSMTMATLQAASDKVRANTVWPARTVATAATRRLERMLPEAAVGAYTLGRPASHTAEAVFQVAMNGSMNAQSLLDDDVVTPKESFPAAPLDAFVEDWCTTKSFAC